MHCENEGVVNKSLNNTLIKMSTSSGTTTTAAGGTDILRRKL